MKTYSHQAWLSFVQTVVILWNTLCQGVSCRLGYRHAAVGVEVVLCVGPLGHVLIATLYSGCVRAEIWRSDFYLFKYTAMLQSSVKY